MNRVALEPILYEPPRGVNSVIYPLKKASEDTLLGQLFGRFVTNIRGARDHLRHDFIYGGTPPAIPFVVGALKRLGVLAIKWAMPVISLTHLFLQRLSICTITGLIKRHPPGGGWLKAEEQFELFQGRNMVMGLCGMRGVCRGVEHRRHPCFLAVVDV